MYHTLSTSIHLGGQELSFSVRYSPGHPQVNYLSNGDPGYPAEPADWEIESVHWKESNLHSIDITELWNALDLSDSLFERLDEEFAQTYAEQKND